MADREVVVDSNVALNFVLVTNPYHRKARTFFEDCARSGTLLLAPPLYECEVDSAIRSQLLRGYLNPEAAQAAQALLDALPVEIVNDATFRRRSREIAELARQSTVYDATYAALAELRGCSFWTADEAFYQATHAALSFVKFLGNYRRKSAGRRRRRRS